MHLLYLDESGNTGPNDARQPWYVLGGLVVHESEWQSIETALEREIDRRVPPPRRDTWELHMVHIHHATADFQGMPAATRFALVDAVFDTLERHRARLIIVAIDKQAHLRRYLRPEPAEDVAYRLMLERFNSYVGRQHDRLGIVVCDEQQQSEPSTRSAHSRYRRNGTGIAHINHVIETPFFTPSHWSRMLQIIDVATYYAARRLRNAPAPYWPRIEPLLDGYPQHSGKGLKTFP